MSKFFECASGDLVNLDHVVSIEYELNADHETYSSYVYLTGGSKYFFIDFGELKDGELASIHNMRALTFILHSSDPIVTNLNIENHVMESQEIDNHVRKLKEKK